MGIDDILRPKSTEEIEDLERRGFRKDKGKWRFTIDIKNIIEAYDKNEDVEQFRSSILNILAQRVDDVGIFANDDQVNEFENIVEEFRDLGEKPNVEEVDTILEKLYDWADQNDVWINSF